MKIGFGVLRFSESSPLTVAHPNKKKLPFYLKPVETNSQKKVNQLLAQKKSIWKWTRQIKNSKVDVHKLKPIIIEFVKFAQCLLPINIQRLLCTMIKLHVVKEVIQSSSSLPFITNFNLFVNANTLTDFSTYFKDVIQCYYCQFSPVSA